MIISENPKPSLDDFRELMRNTDLILNQEAKNKQEYFLLRNGIQLESDVFDALNEAAENTSFEGTIQLVSGSSFPDIVANKLYGVEVKSTNKNHWKSIGSSILESTRVQDVERIYLTFGKLGKPVEFMSRPYEECLSGISVTHYPRYQIDMELEKGSTIFDKIGVSYDELRKMDNPVQPVSKYYKSLLKQGESLWWAASEKLEDNAIPPTVRLWSTCSHEEKEYLTVYGYLLFPEVLSVSGPKKYNRYALWLATQKGILNTNVRDGFSAGGKCLLRTVGGVEVSMPAAFGRIKKYKHLIEEYISSIDESILSEYWETDINEDRLSQWCKMVCRSASTDPNINPKIAWLVLEGIFPQIIR